jgi:hypothetical protein
LITEQQSLPGGHWGKVYSDDCPVNMEFTAS